LHRLWWQGILLCLAIGWDEGLVKFCLCWSGTAICLLSASQEARIGVNQQYLSLCVILMCEVL
jgi:hypothetical protein